MSPDAGAKKKQQSQADNSYSKDRNFVRSIQDTCFIPYLEADTDNFLDVVEGEQKVLTPNY